MKPETMQTELAKHGIDTKIKSQSFTIRNESIRANAIQRIQDIPLDGSAKVTISASATKSARQRGLQWTWYKDVVRSGIGGEDESDEHRLDLVSKYRWCLPIKLRTDDFFAELYGLWVEKYGKDKERMMWFVESKVHTEELTPFEMAEYLTRFQAYYTSKGVNLSEPEDYKLLEFEKRMAA